MAKISQIQVSRRLLDDHQAVSEILKQLLAVLNNKNVEVSYSKGEVTLTSVLDVVLEVEKRLANHNQIEENQVYCWAGKILTEAEQIDLATHINAELQNRPSRFSADAWANDL